MKKQLLFTFILFLMGCELIVDIDVPFEGPSMTLNSFFNPDSVFSVQLTANRHVLDEQGFSNIYGATITIHDENDNLITTLVETYFENGSVRYVSDEKPLTQKSYTIKVTAPDFQGVQSKSSCPLAIPLDDVKIEKNLVDGFPSWTFKIKFRDDPAVLNYYEFFVSSESDYLSYDGKIRQARHRVFLGNNDPSINSGKVTQENQAYEFVFNDLLLKENNELEFKTPWTAPDGKRVIITLRSLSEEMYNYKVTDKLQEMTSGDPFAQPVNVFNNIKNGFGIFAGHNQSAFVVVNPVPKIISVEPAQGKVGDPVTIVGENFSPYRSEVLFMSDLGHPRQAYPVIINGNSVQTTVPSNAVTGKIYVQTGGSTIESPVVFEVIK